MTSDQATIAELRQRYEALKATGHTPKTLPGPSPRPAPARMAFAQEIIPAGWYSTMILQAGQTVRIANRTRRSSVAFVAWRRDEPSERLNYADTVKVQWTTALEKGRVIFSDMGRVMLSVVEDSCGCHDTLVGGSTAATTLKKYGEGHRNTRDNFLLAALKLGLGERDIPPCITFFAPLRVDQQGRFVWHNERQNEGDYVELRAEMDLLIALSNCPHPLDPADDYSAFPVEVSLIESDTIGADDLCRTATDEARRGFENLNAIAV